MLIVFKKRAIETKTKTETKIQRLNHENTHIEKERTIN